MDLIKVYDSTPLFKLWCTLHHNNIHAEIKKAAKILHADTRSTEKKQEKDSHQYSQALND